MARSRAEGRSLYWIFHGDFAERLSHRPVIFIGSASGSSGCSAIAIVTSREDRPETTGATAWCSVTDNGETLAVSPDDRSKRLTLGQRWRVGCATRRSAEVQQTTRGQRSYDASNRTALAIPGSAMRRGEPTLHGCRASWLLIIALGALAGFTVVPQAAAQPSRGALTPGAFAITGVSVVPMTSEIVLKDSTVLVRDGRIVAVGPGGSVTVPAEARVIDGRGKFLIPGLADMHTHLFSDEEVPDSMAADEFGVMLANGVTTIRLMIGRPGHLTMRRDIEAGRLLGPAVVGGQPAVHRPEGHQLPRGHDARRGAHGRQGSGRRRV